MADPATATSGATTLPLRAVTGPIQVAIIQFGAGSAALDASDLAVLQDVARMYRRSGGRVRVEAHASQDARGAPLPQAGNLDVSLRRGTTVVETLLRLGVPVDAITMEARADAQPIYSTATTLGIAANRRAEIFLDF